MDMDLPLVFRGTLVHTPTYGTLDILEDKIIAVKGGKIVKVAEGSSEESVLSQLGVHAASVRRMKVCDGALLTSRWEL